MLLAALVAELGIRQVFRPALGAEPRLRLCVRGMAASGTELCIRGKVLAAVAAFPDHQLLVPAHGAEFGVDFYTAVAFRALCCR